MPTPPLTEVLTAGDTIADGQQITLLSGEVAIGRLITSGDVIELQRLDSGSPIARIQFDGAGRITIRNAAWGEVAVTETGDVDIASPGITLHVGADGNITAPWPTSDPAVADALWNDAGTLKVSAG